jgi:hypothetical protein
VKVRTKRLSPSRRGKNRRFFAFGSYVPGGNSGLVVDHPRSLHITASSEGFNFFTRSRRGDSYLSAVRMAHLYLPRFAPQNNERRRQSPTPLFPATTS